MGEVVAALSVAGGSGNQILKRTLKELAGDRYARWVADDRGERIRLTGHRPRTPELEAVFEAHDVLAVLVLRDPRDNLVNLINRSRNGWCGDKFQRPGGNVDASTYDSLVRVGGDPPLGRSFVDWYVDGIGARPTLDRIFQVAEWRTSPRVHTIRLEDLLDLHGEDADAPRRTIDGMAAFLGVTVSERKVDRLVATGRTWVRQRATEDPGLLTRWDELFTEADREAFERHFGPLLVDLGYERDGDW
jgi:hypothetical protein